MRIFNLLAFLFVLMALPSVASAYIGPGSGISVIGSLFGLLVTVLLAVGVIVLWPFRRMLKRKREQEHAAGSEAESEAGQAPVESKSVRTDLAEKDNDT